MTTKNYIITPPPQDKGTEPLFRVVYSIDINASNEAKAAEKVWHIMQDKNSYPPILVVIDSQGKQTECDLLNILEFNKITIGFVSQRYRKDKSGKFKCVEQEFIAGNDIHYENNRGVTIESPDYENQTFNMTLLSKDEIINRLNEILENIDVGGEQSRQFSNEIESLNSLLKELNK